MSKTIKISFGAGAIAGWNAAGATSADADTTGVKIADCLDIDAVATGIELFLVTKFTSRVNSTSIATQDHHGIPEAVWDSYWSSTIATDPASAIRLSGFTAASTYTIDVVGRVPNVGRNTVFNVEGAIDTYIATGVAPTAPSVPIQFTGTVAGDGIIDIALSGVSVSYALAALIITYAEPVGAMILNVDTDDSVLDGQAGVVINTQNITTATVTVNLKVNDDSITVAQDIDSTTANSITLTSIALGNNPFTAAGRQLQIDVNDGTAYERNVTVNPASGKSVVQVDAAPVTALVDGYITSIFYGYTGTAPAIGDQIEYDTLDSEGNAITMANNSGGIDGTFSIAGSDTLTTFVVRWWNPTDYWSNSATVTVSNGVIVSVGQPRSAGRSRTTRMRR